ncbi:MAG: hypothetical protein IJ158_05520 [Treponema sp.]|nr:hypothetical protein [Treponema sp.]
MANVKFIRGGVLFHKLFYPIFALVVLAAGSFVACSDGNNGKNEDAAVATWVQDTDQTNFYIFYGDKTVEYYESNKCIYTRNELSYEGAPTTTGALTIKNRAGITIKTFIVVNANSSVVATEMDSGTKFTMQKTSSNKGTENNVVCKWVFDGDESSYYIFYADKTVDVYSSGKLENKGLTKYTGDPTKAGETVKINIVISGMTQELLSYTVKSISGNVVITSYNGFDVKFITGTDSGDSTSGNTTGNSGSTTGNTSGTTGTSSNVVCKWVFQDDATSYYIFYSDNSVDVYSSGKLENKGLTKYTGDPTKKGETVKINVVMSGVTQELLSYTVKSISGNIVTTSYNGFDVKFTMGTSSDSTSGNTTGNSGSTSGTTGTSSNVVCKWVFQDDATSYYIFYTDNSVDVYSYDKLENKGLTKYTGDPTKVGETVKINVVMSGVTQELLSYTIKSISGNIVVASYNGFEMKFTMGTSTDSTPSNSGNSSIENVENKTNANTTENSYDNVLVYDCDEITITDETGTIGTTVLFDGGLFIVQTQAGKIKIVESTSESHHYIQASCGSTNLSKLESQTGYLKVKAAQVGSEKIVFTFKKVGSTITDNYIVLIDEGGNELGRSEVVRYSSTDDSSEILTREITAMVPEYFYVVFVRSAGSGGFKFSKIEQLY